MAVDLSEDPAGRATAFSAACVSTYVFVRNMVMKPAIKSCNQRCTDLEKAAEWLKEQLSLKDNRIGQLETVLLTYGNGAIRNALQAAISESRVETEVKIAQVERKIEGES